MKNFSSMLLQSLSLFGIILVTLQLSACSGSDSNELSQNPPVNPPVNPPTTARIGIYDSTVVEGADDLEFVVSLTTASSETITVDYATSDDTAVAGTDYTTSTGTISFAPGEVRKFIPVSVIDNPSTPTTSSKSLQLGLSNPVNAELEVATATGTIIDHDNMPNESSFDRNWGPVGVFDDANSCASCHDSDGTIMQYNNENVSPNHQWQHSVMAHSFNDPYWQAAVEDETNNFPHLTGFIEDTCTKCHAPMGRTHAHQTGTNLDTDNFYRLNTAKAQDHAREGISCTTCHLIQDQAAESGNYIVSDSERNIFGPYANPRINPMLNNSGYTPQHAVHLQASEMCASCHTLYTPAIDPATGLPSGPNTGLPSATKGFLEQGPFLEWQNSIYSEIGANEAQCQDCHMPTPSDTYQTEISTMGSVSPRSPFAQHTLVGGNAHLLEILSDYRSELGISGSTSEAGFDEQIELTREFLENSSANITISTPLTVGNELTFDVEVSNLAGHKMPSAYPSRRTWLHVTVRDGSNTIIFESGKPDSRGYISTDEARLKADCMSGVKLDGFDSSLCYEPHRDLIEDESQVAIYETVLGDINGVITHTLLYGAQYLKDNRIPPVGFTNSTAASIDTQTIPVGTTGDADFNCINTTEGCGADTVHYQIDTEGHSGPYAVEARLLYQATQPGFVDGMHTDSDLVNRFKVMYDEIPPSVEVLATATQ